MAFPVMDRYSQLIQKIITGSFYENLGIVIPLRNDPTQMRLETSEYSTEFGLYLNEVFSGTVTSDANGNVVFSRLLPKGELIISLLSRSTGRRFESYVTVRDYAIWLASYAQAFELIDDNIAQVRDNICVNFAELEALEDVYGDQIGVYANIGQGVDAYRNQVHELRMAYKNFGGNIKGLNEAVAAFTQVEPFGYLRRFWGPNWVLDQSMLVNNHFEDRSSVVSKTANITGVSVINVEPSIVSNPMTPHELHYNATSNELTFVPDGVLGVAVTAVDGEIFLPGPCDTFAWVLGRDVSSVGYVITGGVNDHLYLNIDNLGIIDITLHTNLPNPTTADVLGDITSALFADVRYGLAYSGIQSLYNTRVFLRGDAIPWVGSVEVLNGPYNAAGDIIGAFPGDIQFGPESPLAGVEIQEVNGGTDRIISEMGTSELQYTYNGALTPPYSFAWRSPASLVGPSVSTDEDGDYELVDNDGNVLKLHVYLDELPTVSSNVNFTIGYTRRRYNDQQTGGLWVQVTKDDLPVGNQVDVVTVYDDVTDGYVEIPDYWFIQPSARSSAFYPSSVATGSGDGLEPVSAFKFRITDALSTDVSLLGHVKRFPLDSESPKGCSYPLNNPGFIYDYEGYFVKFSCWISSLGIDAATVTLNISFDGGDNWTSGVATPISVDSDGLGYSEFTYVELETPIVSDIYYRTTVPLTWEDSGVLVRIDVNKPAAAMDILIDTPDLQVKYISSGYLGNATVPRSVGRQYEGGLMWVWSKEEMSLAERAYLGVPHTTVDKFTPYAGLTISFVSDSTPAGNGLLEYSYTPTGSIRKFRWTPFGTAWAPGVGWVTITSDGSYTLTAPDSSYLTVYCTYSLLGTSSTSKTVSVSDETVNVGQSRKISPACFSLDIYDATEYNTSGVAKNLVGTIDESDFSLCGLINLDIQASDPFKYSFAYPEYESPVLGESLTLSLVGPNWVATLDYYSDEDQEFATLYENGIPVPNTMWSFSAANEVSIPDAYFASGDLSYSSTFTLDYALIYQLTSTVYVLSDVNTDFDDYAWWADYYLYTRYESVQNEYQTRSALFFNYSNGRAVLTNRSAANKAMSSLLVQQAQEIREIPKSYWKFFSDSVVEIDKAYLVDGQYYLDHQELRVYEEDPLNIVFEHRSGVDYASCVAARWSEIEKNEAISVYQTPPYAYHQLRLSISGIRDLRDFRIRSMVLKGLNLRGATPSVNGLTSVWLGA